MKIIEASELLDYPLTNMFINECQEAANMWLIPNGINNVGFILDYGCELFLTKFELKNAYRESSNTR